MSSIIVGVRVRPFNQRELKYNSVNIIKMSPQENCIYLSMVRQGKVLKDEKPKEFVFDHALWTFDQSTVDPIATQKYTYDKMGLPVLENVLTGYNACLFAYGQTGSGKTYSMMGYGPDAGVIPRLCEDLYKHISDTHEGGTVTNDDGSTSTTVISVEAAYLEIYNEIVKDLLASEEKAGHGLKIRQHPKTGVFVEGLTKQSVASKDGIVKLLDDGQALRSVAATNMNATSSRSHAILMLTVTHTTTNKQMTDGKEIVTTAVKAGKLSLVDLAGSERASSTGATGDTLTEGSNINKSLTFLGMCLSRLAEVADSGAKGGHIPFRDSSLTFLLSDNLGGNSKTSMLANISPAEINFDETLSTLRFAQVTKKVKNHAVVNENPTAKLIRELKDELEQLKADLKKAQEKKLAAAPAPAPATAPSPPAEEGKETAVASTEEASEGAGAAQPETESTAAATAEGAPAAAPVAEGSTEKEATTCSPNDDSTEPGAEVDDEAALLRRLKESEAAALELEREEEQQNQEPNTAAAPDETTTAAAESGKRSSVQLVDWRKPQLVNLCPEGAVLVVPIEPGPNEYSVQYRRPSAAVEHKVSEEEVDGFVAVANLVDNPSTDSILKFGIDFVPLLNTATFSLEVVGRGATEAEAAADKVLPSVNGEVLEPASKDVLTGAAGGGEAEGWTVKKVFRQQLGHSDRLVLGSVAFRFSHSSSLPSMPEFSSRPTNTSHLELLEQFQRHQEIYLPSLNTLATLTSEAAEELAAMAPIPSSESEGDTAAAAPASPLAASLESVQDLVSSITMDMRQAEEALIADYPITLEEQNAFADEWRANRLGAKGGAGGAAGEAADDDYGAVVEEAKRGVESKNDMIAKLKEDLAKAAVHRRKREQSMVRHAKEAEELRQKQKAEEEAEAEMVGKSVEEELLWHAKVRRLRAFNANGPADTADHAHWVKVNADPKAMPFLQEVINGIVTDEAAELAAGGGGGGDANSGTLGTSGSNDGSSHVLAPTVGEKGKKELPVKHCGVLFKQDQKGKRWDERFGAINGRFLYYFGKCDGRERAKGCIYLYGATVARPSADLGKKHCLLLTSACPRRLNDSWSFYFAFPSADDLDIWESWITERAAPPMPKSMKERLREQEEALIEQGKKKPRATAASGSVTVGAMGKFNWKSEQNVNNCRHCNTGFGLFTRKYHCDTCGDVFCDKCAPKVKGDERQCGMCRQYGASRPAAGNDFELLDDE